MCFLIKKSQTKSKINLKHAQVSQRPLPILWHPWHKCGTGVPHLWQGWNKLVKMASMMWNGIVMSWKWFSMMEDSFGSVLKVLASLKTRTLWLFSAVIRLCNSTDMWGASDFSFFKTKQSVLSSYDTQNILKIFLFSCEHYTWQTLMYYSGIPTDDWTVTNRLLLFQKALKCVF